MLLMLAIFLAGLVVGSFLTVAIARLPARQSLWSPRAACPACGSPIGAYDTIPLLSFALLRGACRYCRSPISWRYPVVEAVTGGLFALAFWRFGVSAALLPALVLLAALVVITGIDLAHQLIPDRITLPGIAVGLMANIVTGQVSWAGSVIGAAAGAMIFFAIIVLTRGGMGGGDMKLAAMLGAFLGWPAGLFAFFIAVMLGSVVSMTLLISGRRGRKDLLPFGPFLAVGGATALFVDRPWSLFGS